jgi:hypothetical protein
MPAPPMPTKCSLRPAQATSSEATDERGQL